jgi:hypothetical protein
VRRSRLLLLVFAASVAVTAAVDLATRPPRGATVPAESPHEETVPAPPGRCTISGTLALDGVPQAGRLELRWRGDGPEGFDARSFLGHVVARVEAGPDGRFARGGLPPGDWLVVARGAQGGRGGKWVRLAPDGAEALAPVQLIRGAHAVRGRLRRGDGTPMAGWALLAWAPRARAEDDDEPAMRIPVDLDAEGRFSVKGLPEGRASLTAHQPGVCVATSPWFEVPSEGTIELASPEEVSVSGRLVSREDGRPVVGAEVALRGAGERGGSVRSSARTDVEGRWRSSRTRGESTVRVTAEGFVPAMWILEPGRPDPEEVRLSRAATLSGRVVRESDGAAVAGVRVALISPDPRRRFYWAESQPSDAQGGYRVQASAGVYALTALGAGHVLPAGGIERVLEGERPPEVVDLSGGDVVRELTLVPGVVVRGVVVDAEGGPVRGAVVEAKGGSRPYPAAVATDADGRFVLDALDPGAEYEVRVARGSGVVLASSLVPSTIAAPLHLTLPPERTVAVLALRSDGRPLSRSWIGVAPASDRFGDPAFGRTDDRGFATIEGVRPGDLVAVAWDTWRWWRNSRVPLEPRADGTLLARFPAMGTARGRVRLAAGGPAAGSHVEVFSMSPADRLGLRTVRTDADGRFEARDLPTPPPYRLHASAWVGGALRGGVASQVEEDAEAIVTIGATGPGAPVSLRVVDPDGRPVASATVSYSPPGGPVRQAFVHGGATLLFADASRGLDVEVHGARDEGDVPLHVAPTRRRLTGGGDDEVRLDRGRTLRGTVRSPGDEPLAGAVVEARAVREPPSALRPSWRADAAAFTDERGRFSLPGLGEETYDVEVRTQPPSSASPSVRIARWTDEVDLVARPGVAVRVRVVDPEGRPVAGARVRPWSPRKPLGRITFHLLDAPPRWHTDAAGDITLLGLDPQARYVLGVVAGDEFVSYEANEWSPADTTVVLRTGFVVEGHVRTPGGAPLEGAGVHWRVPGTRGWSRVEADARGRFRIVRSPSPAPEVVATPSRWIDPDPEAVPRRLTAADANVLIVDPGRELVVRIRDYASTGSNPWARLSSVDRSDSWRAIVERDGTVRFRGLSDRTYSLWIGPTPDGRFVRRRPVSPSDSPLLVRSVAGTPIRGRVVSGGGPSPWELSVTRGDIAFDVRVEADGTFSVPGVPEGRYLLRASAFSAESVLWSARVEAEGGDLDVVLTMAPETR